jgi:hypothetical protein
MCRFILISVLVALTVLTTACERLKHELGGPSRSNPIVMYEEPRVTYTYEIDPNVPVMSHLNQKAVNSGF